MSRSTDGRTLSVPLLPRGPDDSSIPFHTDAAFLRLGLLPAGGAELAGAGRRVSARALPPVAALFQPIWERVTVSMAASVGEDSRLASRCFELVALSLEVEVAGEMGPEEAEVASISERPWGRADSRGPLAFSSCQTSNRSSRGSAEGSTT